LKKNLNTIINIPGSKSYTNRALILAALTKGSVILHHPLYSDDTEVMIACLRILGLRIDTLPDQIIVYDDISVVQNIDVDLFARDSGTTIRFLLPLLCFIPGKKTIEGTPRLNERPIQPLVEALNCLGANIKSSNKNGQPPLKIISSSLQSGKEIVIDASMSSQFLSGLLMISPLLNGLTIYSKGKVISEPYVKMTVQLMREWGINVEQLDHSGYRIPPGQHYKKKEYVIEGDFSSAGYFLAIAVLNQTMITLKNLNPLSIQADREFLNILINMGNEIIVGANEITIHGKKLQPVSINMEGCPDQVQTMAVLAAFAKGTSIIFGVRSLRVKETERVQALKNELAKMGIATEDTHDTLTIHGGNPREATIETYGDHRMAMAFAVAGTKLPGINILNKEVVNKTFPTFWEKLRSL
jgi:3-phosphoshikimate 1-carboxyvinyltransferase